MIFECSAEKEGVGRRRRPGHDLLEAPEAGPPIGYVIRRRDGILAGPRGSAALLRWELEGGRPPTAMVALSPVGKAGIAAVIAGRGACYASAVPSRTSLGKGRCSEERDDESGNREAASSEKLDEWMRESVVEIVRNIGEAPFLMYVFSIEGSDRNVAAPLRLQMEAASAESWPAIRRKWDRGAARPPDGIVLVEELAGDVENSDAPAEERGWSKTWGVPVQARGQDTSAACYILRTCRVPSAAGHSTHFYLARAKCFGDADDAQLREVWLLRRSQQKHQRRRRRRGW